VNKVKISCHYSFQLVDGFQRIHLLLFAGHCISVYKPMGYCQALLQCKGDHSMVCHIVLFLFHFL